MFYLGVSTSAYQIEGATDRGISIWDTFCKKEGAILDGSSGERACDHYRLWEQDLELMKQLHLNAYRFSIAWPRIFPDKTGRLSKPGLDFYSRLVDKLLESGIEPFPTLYHWDLPQYIQDEGGWAVRSTCHRFADYAGTVFCHLQDRVTHWTTLNEPYISAFMGYLTGAHAPGIQSEAQALAAVHHLLLAHGMAVDAMRAIAPRKFGIALNLSPAFPADQESIEAAARYDALHNQLFLEPLFKQRYPEGFFGKVHSHDMAYIATPLEFLGINYYARGVVQHDPAKPLFRCRLVPQESDCYPEGLMQLLCRIQKEYSPKEILILENGTAMPEGLGDKMRIAYLQAHLEKVLEARQKGIPVSGYFVWSLLDNFEWAAGYTKRFGLVQVDFETQKRTLRNSSHWYSMICEQYKKKGRQIFEL